MIWLILLVLVGFFGWAGSRLGAIWMAIQLVGIWLGIKLGGALGPKLVPTFSKFGEGDNPLVMYVAPPLVAFLVVYIIFLIIAYVVNDKLRMFYKYKMPDEMRVRWETMISRVGLSVGLATGFAHFVALGLIIHCLGYWAVQVKSDNTKSFLVKQMAPMFDSLQSSGMHKVILSQDPFPQEYYDAADVMGILYHNPTASRRLTTYPETLTLSETAEFQAMSADAEFQKLWVGQPDFKEFLAQEKIRALIKNKDLFDRILALDMHDLFFYLKDGVSPKYKDDLLLGRWDLNLNETVRQLSADRPDLAADLAVLYRIKNMIGILAKGVTLVASPAPESAVMLKGNLTDYSPIADILNGRRPSELTNAPTEGILIQGTWQKGSGTGEHVLTFKAKDGKDQTENLQILPNRSLVTGFFGGKLIFTKQD